MANSIQDIIKNRRSVRTFNGQPLTDADRKALTDGFGSLENPFGVAVAFRLLNAEEHGLSSPVIRGTDLFVAAKAERAERYELGYGYSFERFCLFAASLNMGTVMLAGTLNRSAFEAAMDLSGGEVMPVASPVGYAADRRSMRESMMRKAIKADERLPFDRIFFDRSFDTGLTPASAGRFEQALAMTRLAPSAVNKQPWRAVVTGDRVDFYEKKTIRDDERGDLQLIDMGIALAHFDLTAQESGMKGRFDFDDPALPCGDDVHYVITYFAD